MAAHVPGSADHENGGTHESSLDFQDLRDAGQVARALGRHERDIFDANTADAEIVKTRLHGHDMARSKLGAALADGRRLVDLQTQPVAGTVEEALHASVAHAGRVAT